MRHVLQQFFILLSHSILINFFFWTPFPFFFLRRFYLLTQFLSFNLYLLSSSDLWLFLVFFRILWMLVTVNKLKHMWFKACHLPHASRITTLKTIFTQTSFSVSTEIGLILVTRFLAKRMIKSSQKRVLAVHPKTATRSKTRRRKKQLEWQLQSFFRYTQTQKVRSINRFQ